MYLISAYFDEKANKVIQGYIDKIAEMTGNDFMTKNNVPPHMTISAIEAKSIEVLVPAFQKLKWNIHSGQIMFASVGQLLPYVMYCTPVMNEYLLSLSKQIYEAYKDIPETSISRYYQPFSWLPHVTVAKTLDKKQMQMAFEIMQDGFSPFRARIIQIGLAKVNPHEDIVKIDL